MSTPEEEAADGTEGADGADEDHTQEQLAALRQRGFRFIDPRDDEGEIVALVGVRVHHNVIDVVRLPSEDDAVAARLPSDADILAPARVFWEQAGSVGEVLAKLLALPDDRVPGSLIAISGCR